MKHLVREICFDFQRGIKGLRKSPIFDLEEYIRLCSNCSTKDQGQNRRAKKVQLLD